MQCRVFAVTSREVRSSSQSWCSIKLFYACNKMISFKLVHHIEYSGCLFKRLLPSNIHTGVPTTVLTCLVAPIACRLLLCSYQVASESNNPWGRNALVHVMTSRPLHLAVKASNQAYKTTHYNVFTLFDSQQPIP